MTTQKRDWSEMTLLETINSDEFLELPATAQLLYFHLYVRSDMGYVNNARSIARLVKVEEDMVKNLWSLGIVEEIDELMYFVPAYNNTYNLKVNHKNG